ncbi:MAG TPA: DegT/DnrJ/EryC1/StrS family aminotransferase [Bryobacteraceae bacterium]|nr:DegT/DnrJ/EryC1/StrS family aminotransferase [Bryobacteraceae bacterium]
MSTATTAIERKVPLLDLRALHAPVREEILAEMTRVVDSQAFILGEDVKALEKSIAEYCRVSHAVGCASGSDALLLALLAAGVKPGDCVATTPFTFFATAGAIVHAGATPVFVDIQPDTFNIDPNQIEAALRTNRRIKAVIPVHLFGGCADMDPIVSLARERGCAVIEDAAQSIGAEYKGQRALFGDAGCISFFPSKNLGAFGDGGMVVANEGALAGKLAALRVHGALRKYFYDYVGINSRLDTLQAAILRVKLKFLDAETAGRQKNSELYRSLLHDLPITLPRPADYQTRHVYNQFVIRAPRRDELKSHLQENGIGSEIYYPLSLHQQVCFKDLGYGEGDFPESEKAAREVLALPIHSALSNADIEYVSRKIAAFYRLA